MTAERITRLTCDSVYCDKKFDVWGPFTIKDVREMAASHGWISKGAIDYCSMLEKGENHE